MINGHFFFEFDGENQFRRLWSGRVQIILTKKMLKVIKGLASTNLNPWVRFHSRHKSLIPLKILLNIRVSSKEAISRHKRGLASLCYLTTLTILPHRGMLWLEIYRIHGDNFKNIGINCSTRPIKFLLLWERFIFCILSL